MRMANLGFCLLFFSCTRSMEVPSAPEGGQYLHEKVAADRSPNTTEDSIQTRQLWREAFDESSGVVPPAHQSAITQLLTACKQRSTMLADESINQHRLFMEQCCKEASAEMARRPYVSEAVQRAWDHCASKWDGVVSSIERLRPKAMHQATHLAAYILAKLYEKSLPAITDEMVCATEMGEETNGKSPATQKPDDHFLELKYSQISDLFERTHTTHPTLKTHINMYTYLVMNDFLRQRFKPSLEQHVNIEAFSKTCALLPKDDSLACVATFIPEECELLRQLPNFKELTTEQQECMLQKSWHQGVPLLSSYMQTLIKKNGSTIPRTLGPADRQELYVLIGEAIHDGHIEKVTYMLSLYKLDIDAFFNFGKRDQVNFLYLATLAGNIEIIKLLLEKGANPHATTRFRARNSTCLTTTPYRLAKRLARSSPLSKKMRLFRRYSATEIVKDDGKPAEARIRRNARGNPLDETKIYECTKEFCRDFDHPYGEQMQARYKEIFTLFNETLHRHTASSTSPDHLLAPLRAPSPERSNAYLVPPAPGVHQSHRLADLDRMIAASDPLPEQGWELSTDPNAADQPTLAAGPSAAKQITEPHGRIKPAKKHGFCCTCL